MKKNIQLIMVIIGSMLLTNCVTEDKKIATNESPAIVVKLNQITTNDNTPFLSVSGKIQASNSAELSTRLMGYVTKVNVNVGDSVREGQLLIAISNSDLQAKRAQINASITEATAALNNAQKDYNRFKSLFEDNSASQKELDDMTTNFQTAQARLEAANQMKNEINAQLAYSNITAPFDGVVTSKSIEQGSMANPGMPLISIEAPGSFEVIAMIPETEISEIRKGTSVQININSIDQNLKGKVTEVSTSAKNTGGQYLVAIAIDKTEVKILSGMYVTVKFPVERKSKSERVLIPTEAIVTQGQLSGVYTVSQSNTALLRWLRLGRTYDNQVEVLSGLSIDESYIVSAEGNLYNGVKVSIQ